MEFRRKAKFYLFRKGKSLKPENGVTQALYIAGRKTRQENGLK
jgi:hypothetical protein